MLDPLYTAVSWVLLRWHWLFVKIGLPDSAGLTWALSIMMLVVTIRILLFRFFIKQVHSQRKMQQMQPKIQALREKYKGDRQTLSQEMMKLQKDYTQQLKQQQSKNAPVATQPAAAPPRPQPTDERAAISDILHRLSPFRGTRSRRRRNR